MDEDTTKRFAWYIDITPNQMFSLYDYPILEKSGLPLCEEHGEQLELKEAVLLDSKATEKSQEVVTHIRSSSSLLCIYVKLYKSAFQF